MVKVRMNTADVAAEVKCLRRLIGMRCSNVYDLSPKVFPFFLVFQACFCVLIFVRMGILRRIFCIVIDQLLVCGRPMCLN